MGYVSFREGNKVMFLSFRRFLGEKPEILHTWKIQVYGKGSLPFISINFQTLKPATARCRMQNVTRFVFFSGGGCFCSFCKNLPPLCGGCPI